MTGIEDRLSALEAEVAQLHGEGESLTPTYLTYDPVTHVIGASFTGHVHAQGLDLDAGTTTTPPANNRVRWIRLSDQSVAADLAAYSSGGSEYAQLNAYALSPIDVSSAVLRAYDDQGNTQAQLLVQQTARGNALVRAFAGGLNRTLIADDGSASFPQLPGALKTQLFWGHFTAGSTAPGTGNSGGFTVVKTAVGQYTITWGNSFTSAGYGFIPVAVNGYCDVLTGSQAAGSVVVELRSFADVLTDLPWNFLALGVAS